MSGALRFVRFLVDRFFHQVEVVGTEHVPAEGGGVLVSWHPNGLMDPALVLARFPRRVIFGARHGLFKVPLLGGLMRRIGTVPIYRGQDASAGDGATRRAANRQSLDALAAEVLSGSFSCLFPEGDSHDAPHLLALKTGAARFYYRARELQDPQSRPPVIIPVGLHYDAKRLFGSNALIEFHPPMVLEADLDCRPDPDESDATRRDRQARLTAAINEELTEAVHATETWELHHQMHRARKLVRAERAHRAGADPGRVDMKERTLGLRRVWSGYMAKLQTHPQQVHALVEQVAQYDADLTALGVEDHDLDRSPRLGSPWLGAIVALQAVLVFFLLPPILLVGYVVNMPPAGLLWLLTRAAAGKRKDEATIKLLVGAVLFPMAWIGAGLAAAWGAVRLHELFPAMPVTPALAGGVTVLLAIAGGVLMIAYMRMARQTVRTLRVRLTRARRHRALARLLGQRAALHDALLTLVEDVDLPGRVAEDGRVFRTCSPNM